MAAACDDDLSEEIDFVDVDSEEVQQADLDDAAAHQAAHAVQLRRSRCQETAEALNHSCESPQITVSVWCVCLTARCFFLRGVCVCSIMFTPSLLRVVAWLPAPNNPQVPRPTDSWGLIGGGD